MLYRSARPGVAGAVLGYQPSDWTRRPLDHPRVRLLTTLTFVFKQKLTFCLSCSLWPDFCDGSYTQYCDESRQYNNISCILESYGRKDLLTFMEKYWKDQSGDDQSFW